MLAAFEKSFGASRSDVLCKFCFLKKFPLYLRPIALRSLLVGLLFFAYGFETTAQTGGSVFPPRIDLETAVEKALENNPQIKIADAVTRLADAKIAEAKAGRMPSVEFSQSVVRSNNPVFVFGSLLEQGRFRESNFSLDALNNPGGLSNFRSLVSFQQPLFDRKQTGSKTSQAEIAKRQSVLHAEKVRQELSFDVFRSYYSVVLGRELLAVSLEAVKSAEANCKKTKDMVEVGMTTDADFLAADVELSSARQQLLEAENNLVAATAALNIAIGQRADRQYELTGDLTEKYFPLDEQNDRIRIAFENRPDYKSAELAVEIAREQSRAVKNQKLPQVSAFGNFGYSSPYIANGSTDYTVGVNLSYTLFDAARKPRREQSATAEAIAELEKESLGNQIRLDVIRALQNYKTARAKIQVSIKSITQAAEALKMIHDRYKFGLTTFNEVLRAESALVRSKHNLLISRFDYLTGYASVLLATGELTDVRLLN